MKVNGRLLGLELGGGHSGSRVAAELLFAVY